MYPREPSPDWSTTDVGKWDYRDPDNKDLHNQVSRRFQRSPAPSVSSTRAEDAKRRHEQSHALHGGRPDLNQFSESVSISDPEDENAVPNRTEAALQALHMFHTPVPPGFEPQHGGRGNYGRSVSPPGPFNHAPRPIPRPTVEVEFPTMLHFIAANPAPAMQHDYWRIEDDGKAPQPAEVIRLRARRLKESRRNDKDGIPRMTWEFLPDRSFLNLKSDSELTDDYFENAFRTLNQLISRYVLFYTNETTALYPDLFSLDSLQQRFPDFMKEVESVLGGKGGYLEYLIEPNDRGYLIYALVASALERFIFTPYSIFGAPEADRKHIELMGNFIHTQSNSKSTMLSYLQKPLRVCSWLIRGPSRLQALSHFRNLRPRNHYELSTGSTSASLRGRLDPGCQLPQGNVSCPKTGLEPSP